MPLRKSRDNTTDKDQRESGSSELTLIANLLALDLVEGKQQEEQIALLAAAGYPPGKIASLLETTPNTVSVTLSKRRSAGKPKTKSKK